jgi:hypothetical protein
MEPHVQEAMEGIRKAAGSMMAASQVLHDASQLLQEGGAAVRVADSVRQPKNEHEDLLRDTVNQLKATVLALVTEVRALRGGEQAMKLGGPRRRGSR